MSDGPVKISITGKMTYSDEISINQAAQIVAFLNAVDDEAGDVGASLGGSKKPGRRTAATGSAREAIEISGAAKNTEKIVALAALVLQDGGVDTFKAEEVKSQFRRAREAVPANFSRDLSNAIAAGWIAEDAAGEYYLTAKVDGVLDGGFTFEAGANSGGRRSTTRSKGGTRAKSGKPDSLDQIDEFHPTMDGLPAYSKMKSEKDRLLWVLTYLRDEHGRKTATNKEVAWISDHIGAGIPSGNLGGAFRQARQPGYALRSTQDSSMKVTDEGVQHLKSLNTDK